MAIDHAAHAMMEVAHTPHVHTAHGNIMAIGHAAHAMMEVAHTPHVHTAHGNMARIHTAQLRTASSLNCIFLLIQGVARRVSGLGCSTGPTVEPRILGAITCLCGT